MSRHSRLLAATTLSALAATSLVGVTSPSQAVIGSQTVTFEDCDLSERSVPTGKTIDVTTTITVEHPSPVPTSSAQSASMTLGTLPAGTFPVDLIDSFVNAGVTFDDGTGSTLEIYQEKVTSTFDADVPLVLGEFEEEFFYSFSGRREFRPKTLSFGVYGDPQDGLGARYYQYDCDQRINPTSLLTIGVFDPAADAGIVLDDVAAKQGGVLGIAGTDFANEFPDDPDGDVTLTVGGLPAGTYDVDETGAFSGALRIPAFVKPGSSVQVRATSSGESAVTTVSITAAKGTVSVSPAVARTGKKVTVTASGYKPGESVKISVKGGRGKGTKAYSSTAKVSAAGVARQTVTLRKAAKGAWKVTVVGPQSFRTAAKAFQVR